jgi:hypothetical protein
VDDDDDNDDEEDVDVNRGLHKLLVYFLDKIFETEDVGVLKTDGIMAVVDVVVVVVLECLGTIGDRRLLQAEVRSDTRSTSPNMIERIIACTLMPLMLLFCLITISIVLVSVVRCE